MAEKTYHHGELRVALVTAALGLLAEEGADALSLRAVARRAGVSAMAPYRHYPDKESLLAAVAVQGFEGLRSVLSAADDAASAGHAPSSHAPSSQAPSSQAPSSLALVAQAIAYVRYARENPALFRLMFGPMRIGAHPDLVAAGEAAYAVLAERVAVETPPDADRQAIALGCWSLVHGLAALFLDGRISDKVAAPGDDVTYRVAEAMLAARRRAVAS